MALPEVTEGAAVTALKGCEGLPDGEPILFNDCDHLFVCRAFNEFCAKGGFANGPAGALLTFESDSPAYSYLQYGADGNVCHTVEKQVVSHDAICGAYYFKDKKTYADACAEYLKNCEYKEFLSPAFTMCWPRRAQELRALRVIYICRSARRTSTARRRHPPIRPVLTR